MSFPLPRDGSRFKPNAAEDPIRDGDKTKITQADYVKYSEDQDEWFDKKMRERWFYFTEVLPIKTTFITWNVAESDPSQIPIEHLFDDSKMFVVVLEEINMSLSGMMTFGQSELLIQWQTLFESALPKIRRYDCVFSQQHGGLAMFIFSSREECLTICDLKVSTVTLGQFGVVGNKGAIGVSCRIGACRVLFVGAHFTAGDGPEKCDECYWTTRKNLNFELRPEDHDYEVWMGDFNYRLDLEESGIRHHLNDIPLLFLADQLSDSVAKSNAFAGFIEAPVLFGPTYRLEKGTDKLDWKRNPAWCDRVLFRVSQLYQISLRDYTSLNICYSDHLPVRCTTLLKPRFVNEKLMKESWKEILGLANKISLTLVPVFKVQKVVEIGEIRPYQKDLISIPITNCGGVDFEYIVKFISMEDGTEMEPQWITVAKRRALVKTKNTENIEAVVMMTAENVRNIREGKQFIIQVSVLNGPSSFIEVVYTTNETSFGLSPEELIKHQEPFLKFPSTEACGTHKVPKEILSFVNVLDSNKTSKTLFTTIPSNTNIDFYQSIFLSVDAMKGLGLYDVNLLSEAFLIYLRALGQLFTMSIFMVNDIDVLDENCSETNRRVLRVVIALCKEIAIEGQNGKSLKELLGTIVEYMSIGKTEQTTDEEIVLLLLTYSQKVKTLQEELE
ncbi:phosphoinositide 5-phosphatase, putative [Entamoeba invadens IP1]|uniref:phosphoinositide 5-phosphatase, putative n=1 Tax=Entamoeba invadens IP1 TaxID=370355 RepID=UPI0002C3F36F|nr:phosphoinositide 5-phosphatase, putative [Entamoeba invadens IP1]ELP94129.1 phosphoinositide 5-phosphatase, putative [Entamoeba invadens IP1]|eukprot:XP_004260900.1 phosphoinositide 5-phosphatase, putative [Entamoeba invadens IP1]